MTEIDPTNLEESEGNLLPQDHPTKIPEVYVRAHRMSCDKCKWEFEPVEVEKVLADPASQKFHKCACPTCGWVHLVRLNIDRNGDYLVTRHPQGEEDANWLPLAVNATVWPVLLFLVLYMIAWGIDFI